MQLKKIVSVFNTVFINPDKFQGNKTEDPERSKNERLISLYLSKVSGVEIRAFPVQFRTFSAKTNFDLFYFSLSHTTKI